MEEEPNKWFLRGCIGSYIAAAVLVHTPIAAALALIGSLICLAKGTPRGLMTGDERPLAIFVTAAIYVSMAILIAHTYLRNADERNFWNYLEAHGCTDAGIVATGYVKPQCDRLGNCDEGGEIEEPSYLCKTTGKTITYSDFQNGSYGL